MNANQPSNYLSYLLRLWRDHPGASWQASLQSASTEKIYQFANAEELWAFLTAQMRLDSDERNDGLEE